MIGRSYRQNPKTDEMAPALFFTHLKNGKAYIKG
jgi:hypothetical protein